MAQQGWGTTRSVEAIMSESAGMGLRRELGPVTLILIGVGTIVGAGIFVLTGTAAAQFAGPAIALSFVLAAAGCALAGLCYAELASVMPAAGSAYSYSYATLGRGIAWMVGWNLVLEYVFAASYVAIGWSGYLVGLLHSVGLDVPRSLSAAPLAFVDGSLVATGALVNLPAILLTGAIGLLVIRGTAVSARVGALIVVLKLAVLTIFVLAGASFVDTANWSPFLPENQGSFGAYGWSGVVRGAGVVFVAFLGFDALAATAQEARNPQRTMPVAILGSIAICALIYVLVALVLTGLVPYLDLDVSNPLSLALRETRGLQWLAPLVDIAAVAGLASVLIVLFIAQPRILLAMSRDGLLPARLGEVSETRGTPMIATLVTSLAVVALSGFLPIELLSQLVSLGTLAVFVAVCVGVLALRRSRPELPRAFRVPAVRVVAPAGVLICLYMLASLPVQSWLLYTGWVALGTLIYFGFGRRAAAR